MIPKIIHYCWFGEQLMPKEQQKFIQDWKEKMPNFLFKFWNEQDIPMQIPYLKNAFQHKKWANISNYMRLYALYHYGGIYMDTDVELLQYFNDNILKNDCFLGFEVDDITQKNCVNNAIMGAIPKFSFVKRLKDFIITNFDGVENANESSPIATTYLLRQDGLKEYGEQIINNIKIYPKEYFYPFAWNEEFNSNCVKDNTIAIHHMAKSWWGSSENVKNKKRSYIAYYKGLIANSVCNFLFKINWIKWNFVSVLENHYEETIKSKREILNGIFKGFKYDESYTSCSSFYPKIIGCYEYTVQKKIYTLLDNKYEKIINIGCDEGYYALGLSILFPDSKVLAFDINEKSIQSAIKNVNINNLIDKVECRIKKIDSQYFNNFETDSKNLIICDCEGDERFIFTNENIQNFINTDLIIEIHPFYQPDVKFFLLDLFSNTHYSEILKEQIPDLLNLKNLDNIPIKILRKLTNEKRPEKMEWLYLTPKIE